MSTIDLSHLDATSRALIAEACQIFNGKVVSVTARPATQAMLPLVHAGAAAPRRPQRGWRQT